MTTSPVRDAAGRGMGLALLAYGLFSSHDVIVKLLGGTYSVFQIIFFGGLFALLPITIFLLAEKKADNLRPHHPWLVIIRTLTILISTVSAFYAFTVLPLAEVYALIFATPLLITALSVPLLGETVRLQRWAAVVLGLVGVIIVLRPGYIDFGLGHAAALLCALSGSLSSIIVRKIGAEERTAVLVLYPLLATIGITSLTLPLVYIPMPVTDLGGVAVLGFLAVAGQMVLISAFRSASAVVIAPIQYSQILWAVPYGFFVFGEKPDLFVGLGASVIVLSGLFIVWRESRTDVSDLNPVLRNPNPRPDVAPSPQPRPVAMPE